MDMITDSGELRRRLLAYAFGNAPDEIKVRLQTLPGVEADVLTNGARLLWAHYDLLDAEGKEVAGLIFQYAGEMHWTAFNERNQSAAIVLAVRRDLGEKGKFPKPENDPEPDATLREGGYNWKSPESEIAEEAAPAVLAEPPVTAPATPAKAKVKA